MIDAEPIVRAVEARGGLWVVLGVRDLGHARSEKKDDRLRSYRSRDSYRWEQAYVRMRRSGRVTEGMADRFCIEVLKVNPAMVYGPAWFEEDSVDESMDWVPDAPDFDSWPGVPACVNADPEIFFPDKGEHGEDAKRVCEGCDVREECLMYALGLPPGWDFGVYGGLTAIERTRLRQRMGRAA